MHGESIRRPVAFALVAGILGVAAVASSAIGRIYARDIAGAGAESLRASRAIFTALERGDVKKMDAALEALSADPELRRLFLARDRAALLAAARPRFERLRERAGITHWYFVDPDRRVFLRVHRPDLHDDVVKRLTLARAAETRDLGAGLELGRTAFALRAVRPWVIDGRVVGYLELAEEIDHFLVQMKRETGNELGLLVKKEFLDPAAWAQVNGAARNTWNAREDVVVVDTTIFSEGIVDFQGDVEALPDDGLLLEEEFRDGRAWIRGIFPVRDVGGRKVGALAVLKDFGALHDTMTAGRHRVLLVVLGMSVLSCLVVWAALEWFLLRPLRRLVQAAEAAQGSGPPLEGADELARLGDVVGRIGPGRRAG